MTTPNKPVHNAVFDKGGRLYSMGSVLSDDLPEGWTTGYIRPPAEGEQWNHAEKNWVFPDPYVPTEEDLAREEEDNRLLQLRAKVGPGKSGLTPAERDELTLILAVRQIGPS